MAHLYIFCQLCPFLQVEGKGVFVEKYEKYIFSATLSFLLHNSIVKAPYRKI